MEPGHARVIGQAITTGCICATRDVAADHVSHSFVPTRAALRNVRAWALMRLDTGLFVHVTIAATPTRVNATTYATPIQNLRPAPASSSAAPAPTSAIHADGPLGVSATAVEVVVPVLDFDGPATEPAGFVDF